MAKYHAYLNGYGEVVDEIKGDDLDAMVAEIDAKWRGWYSIHAWDIYSDGIDIGTRDIDGWRWRSPEAIAREARHDQLRDKAQAEGLTPDEWAEVLGADRWTAMVESLRGLLAPHEPVATLVLNAAIRAGFSVPTVQDDDGASPLKETG